MRPLCYLLIALLVFNLVDDLVFAAPSSVVTVQAESDDEYLPVLREAKQDCVSAHQRGSQSSLTLIAGSPFAAAMTSPPFSERSEPRLTRPCIYVFMSLQI